MTGIKRLHAIGYDEALPRVVEALKAGDDGHAVVTAIDPRQTIAAQHPHLTPIAEEVRAKLVSALERLA